MTDSKEKKTELTSREVSNKNLKPGRPKGSRNKTTLFKEAMKGHFEDLLETEGEKVFRACVQKAVEGDTTAMKLIMDRIIPVADVTGTKGSGQTQVVINVEGMTGNISIADEGQPPEDNIIDVEPLD